MTKISFIKTDFLKEAKTAKIFGTENVVYDKNVDDHVLVANIFHGIIPILMGIGI